MASLMGSDTAVSAQCHCTLIVTAEVKRSKEGREVDLPVFEPLLIALRYPVLLL
jgi:hypothetical protein